MSALAEILFGGLFQGSLYAMMAVGLALVWTAAATPKLCPCSDLSVCKQVPAGK